MHALLKEIILQPNYTVIMEMRGSCLEVQMEHADECVRVCDMLCQIFCMLSIQINFWFELMEVIKRPCLPPFLPLLVWSSFFCSPHLIFFSSEFYFLFFSFFPWNCHFFFPFSFPCKAHCTKGRRLRGNIRSGGQKNVRLFISIMTKYSPWLQANVYN